MTEAERLGQALIDIAGSGTITNGAKLQEEFCDFAVDYVQDNYTPAEVFTSEAGLVALAAWAVADGYSK